MEHMRVKLTDTGIRSYQPRTAQYSIGDAVCPGLRIRITPGGVKTFAFAYRNKGTGRVPWLTLGRYPDVPLARARELANDARKTVAAIKSRFNIETTKQDNIIHDLRERLAVAERLVRVDTALARQLSESIALNSRLRQRIAELEAHHVQATPGG
jgi:Arm DNA-binding domain